MIEPEQAPHYIGHNPLQQLSYTVIYVVAVVMVVTGFAMYGQANPGGVLVRPHRVAGERRRRHPDRPPDAPPQHLVVHHLPDHPRLPGPPGRHHGARRRAVRHLQRRALRAAPTSSMWTNNPRPRRSSSGSATRSWATTGSGSLALEQFRERVRVRGGRGADGRRHLGDEPAPLHRVGRQAAAGRRHPRRAGPGEDVFVAGPDLPAVPRAEALGAPGGPRGRAGALPSCAAPCRRTPWRWASSRRGSRCGPSSRPRWRAASTRLPGRMAGQLRAWGVRVDAARGRRMHEMSVALEVCRLAEERLEPAELPQLHHGRGSTSATTPASSPTTSCFCLEALLAAPPFRRRAAGRHPLPGRCPPRHLPGGRR